MEASWWDEVKNSLLSYLGESEGYSLSTMQLSYNNLPDYLKPCLLYMAMFPEDARIPVSKLISLWIAEGFVQNIESGRLMEEAAEDYLMDLISSNVVMVSRRRYNGKVKYCQVHDVVLHFCLEKSREENFMLVVKGQFQPYDWNVSRVSFSFSDKTSKVSSLGSKTRKFHQHLRSLIMTYDGGFSNWSKLRLLKVLDLGSHRMIDFWSATLKPLIHLKYLAVCPDEFHFHPELHLPHLETLLVKYLFKNTVVPVIFWKMEKLRHVDISTAVFDLEEDKQRIFEESSKLENLRILKGIDIGDADSMDVILQRCPNLEELGIFIKHGCGICPKSVSLTQLQVLHLSFAYTIVVSELHLPSSLKKLVLKVSHMKSVIPFIGGLPSLEYLQLSEPVHSRDWCLGDIMLHKLKFLKLVTLGISRWDASEESFPLLETLVIKECDDLEEIPPSFADIPVLKQIKLIGCVNNSLEASAVKIKNEVTDIEGCDRIDITIKDRQGNLKQFHAHVHPPILSPAKFYQGYTYNSYGLVKFKYQDYLLIDISEDGFVSLLTDSGNSKDDLRLPTDENLLTRIKDGFTEVTP
ncbi:hypothetical protein HAX54_015052 [Datura stramonium]|uniref:Translation initiation factor 5A C-terminal domain-containing protein n=1 Tax=Datura stramonium TaxID=4076 RepID=A0ABS8TPY7_DATST|nr:hypothetical protein [Datura stramonium]